MRDIPPTWTFMSRGERRFIRAWLAFRRLFERRRP